MARAWEEEEEEEDDDDDFPWVLVWGVMGTDEDWDGVRATVLKICT